MPPRQPNAGSGVSADFPSILRRDTIVGFTRDEGGHWNARVADGGEQRIGRSYADNVRRLTGRA